LSEYDTDILAWSERQAALLRRLKAGEQIIDQVDWDNVIEEVESVGTDQLHKVAEQLVRVLVHMAKVQAWPDSCDVPRWEAEIRVFRRQLRFRYAPSMRQKLDLASLYDDALVELPVTMDGRPPMPVPTECPVTLDYLLGRGDEQ
jgi:hypothetical protein